MDVTFRPPLLRATAGLLATVWLAAAVTTVAPAAAAGSAHAVTMANYAFAPAALTVHAGDTVTWTNTDQAPHNVVTTSGPVSITSPTLTTHQSWSFTFTTPGTYNYICGVHPDMHASVVVLAAAAHPSAAPTTHPVATAHAEPMPAMSMSPSKTSPRSRAVAPVTHKGTTAPAPATPVAATSDAAVVAAASTGGVTSARLKPLLLVSGAVVAVTVFCLLALASRPVPPAETHPHP